MRRITSFVLLAAMLASPGLAWAKWPMDRTMTFLVPWPAGTGGDLIARVLADSLSRRWGNTIIVDNKSGAAGTIGQAFAAKARPDGYTFIVTTPGPAANNKLIYQSLPYDPLSDFSYVARLTLDPMLLIAGPRLPVKSLTEFGAYAKANPGKLQFGNPGVGTYAQMTQLKMQDMLSATFNMIQYRGAPQMITDLLSQHIDAIIDLRGGYVPQLQAGTLRALAVFGDKRDPRLADVPTAKEQGVDISVEAWYAMEGPKGIPADIVEQMNAAVTDVLLHDEAARTKLLGIGSTPAPSTSAELAAIVKAELEKWRSTVTKYNIRAE